jgi:glutamate dehydrogenase
MRIAMDRGENRRAEIEESFDKALRLLEAATAKGRMGRLRLLAAALRQQASPLFVEERSPHGLADLLNLLLDLVENRDSSAVVRILPADPQGRSLLLTCAQDGPFLFDAVQTFLKRADLHFWVVAHPLVYSRAVEGGRSLASARARGVTRDSLIVVSVAGFVEGAESALASELQEIMNDLVQLESERNLLEKKLAALQDAAVRAGFRDFWRWLRADNFRSFAYRCLAVRRDSGGGLWVRVEADSALGMPFHQSALSCCDESPLAELEDSFRDNLLRTGAVVTRTDRPSPIHWAERLFYLGFREATDNGWREHAFLGVFTPQSNQQITWDVPALRRRIGRALKELAIRPDTHDYRKTVDLLNTFPKVELFFMGSVELRQLVRTFTLLYRHEAVRILAVPSLAVEGLTLVVMMPRDFYSADTPARLESYLGRRCRTGSVDARIMQLAGDFVSLHVRLGLPEPEAHLDLSHLEQGLTRLCQPWPTKLRRLLEKRYGLQQGGELWRRYQKAFSQEYRTLVHPRFALRDVAGVEQVLTEEGEGFALWGPFGRSGESWRLQFYSLQESYLNEILPILENFGLSVLEEVDFEATVASRQVFIKSFAILPEIYPDGGFGQRRKLLIEGLRAVRCGQTENDPLNRLLLTCGLAWNEIDVFRGYRNYFLQLGAPFSKDRIALALYRNHRAALLLFRYFEARFAGKAGPDELLEKEELALPPLRQELAGLLENVGDINEDRILRAFFNLIDATVRTNFFTAAGHNHPFAFKISSLGVIDMPAPRPLYEISVHSAAMEGIHLRGGRIARGGIRWSDRIDFRSEILGLLKTQITKNALIVPTGAKGGFIVKSLAAEKKARAAQVEVAYRDFIRGLLDLTDNLVADRVEHPAGLAVYDDEDPYLVVAADKGTAHLSDVANEVAAEYRFWLDDAFASGGSHGYDHKQLGITARGAWISVQHHFRQLDIDPAQQTISVVGIGDMSGDVFGNGLLRSDRVRLLAAFDHRHIFLDPDPDPAVSFLERQRLFALPNSSWDDYDRALISAGGGVFSRDAKDIDLSPEVRTWFGCRYTSTDGPGLIRLILTAEADLLWNGGIGTYVKAAGESHQEVDDRANDGVRIDARELRVRVVGEGGNLGFTQRARIEYALAGGRINIDAVDNAGGVVCSDREVNLKILFQHLLEEGLLASRDERDRLLVDLTDEVCELVLADCFGQNLCLSLDAERCAEQVESFFVLGERLANAGLLDFEEEHLPPPKTVLARPGRGFTRPELAVLMAYSKLDLIQSLLESGLPDSEIGREYLSAYFPASLRRRYAEQLFRHPLARQIAATMMSNTLVNQAGSAFVSRLGEQTGALPADVVKTYLAFDRMLEGGKLRGQIIPATGTLSADRRHQLLQRLEVGLETLCRWALAQHWEVGTDKSQIATLRSEMDTYGALLEQLLPSAGWQRCLDEEERLKHEGFAVDSARLLALLCYLRDFMPVVALAARTGAELSAVARLYRQTQELFALPEVRRRLAEVPLRKRWDRMARQSLEDKFAALAFEFPLAVWRGEQGELHRFLDQRRGRLQSYQALLVRLRESPPANFHPFTVLAGSLEALLS